MNTCTKGRRGAQAVSLLIPTLNRPDFVERLLSYYATVGCPSPILIGDSSDQREFEQTANLMTVFQGRLTVRHVACPGFTNYEVIDRLLELVSTPYATYLADDDFLIVSTMNHCVEFLDGHLDYSAAGGAAVVFSLDASDPYGRVTTAWGYPMHTIERHSAYERFNELLTQRYFPAFTCVCRTEVLRKTMEGMDAFRISAIPHDQTWWSAVAFSEELASCAVVIQGRVKILDGLYWVRQVHDRRYLFPDVFDRITSRNWHVCYDHFRQRVIALLTSEEGSNQEAIHAAFKRVFWRYLIRVLSHQYQESFPSPQQHMRRNVTSLLKSLPGARPLWRLIRNTWRADAPSVSLATLLQPGSRYYRDFQPIYRLVTNVQHQSTVAEHDGVTPLRHDLVSTPARDGHIEEAR